MFFFFATVSKKKILFQSLKAMSYEKETISFKIMSVYILQLTSWQYLGRKNLHNC